MFITKPNKTRGNPVTKVLTSHVQRTLFGSGEGTIFPSEQGAAATLCYLLL